ncbi:ATP-binding protein [Nocardia caishijiensis]|uniref:ATPase family protein associated with various cellular activities (AAA) n=1 Tax=Nocardia caishijiensis TaxID=184756 RepID=A0ABQ6YFX7_9NOCA|nr:ATP-binding protein [Nocardia caishijiensis]KAF0842498.1 ATPase family protein associated with various cellular activities (AAA) [Nocardia caishijiensis]
MADDQVLADMLTMLDRSPGVLALRVCVIELLIERERYADALAHCGVALGEEPGNAQVLALMTRCSSALSGGSPQPVPAAPPAAVPTGYDWAAAESQVGDIIAPAFVDAPTEFVTDDDAATLERPHFGLADVGGMDEVKRQLDLTLLGPLRNPELAKAFGTSARGGLLLYGPPGCGKTFIASAVAGELGANFYPIEIADILDIYTGSSERNVHSIFEMARRNAPCVLFLDEVDALGHKRSQMHGSSAMRTVVNQLLTEMDSATHSNEGVFVLGATNHPWDVDVALRRPGRFDRMIFVGLPDAAARRSILHYHLRDRPIAGIDLSALAAHTEGLSGADLAHICTSATQLAMADSMRTGEVRPVGMADVRAALAQVRPSTGAWFESARNVVEFANGDGSYDDLARYLKRVKR